MDTDKQIPIELYEFAVKGRPYDAPYIIWSAVMHTLARRHCGSYGSFKAFSTDWNPVVVEWIRQTREHGYGSIPWGFFPTDIYEDSVTAADREANLIEYIKDNFPAWKMELVKFRLTGQEHPVPSVFTTRSCPQGSHTRTIPGSYRFLNSRS